MNWSSMLDASASSRLCVTLIHSIWQTGLLAGGCWALERWLRPRSVERSYAIYVSAVAMSLALLPATYLNVRIGEASGVSTGSAAIESSAIDGDLARGEPIHATPAEANSRGAASSDAVRATPPAEWAAVHNLSPWLAAMYVAGVLLMFARLVRSMIAGERLRRASTPVEGGPLLEMVLRVAKSLTLRATPALALAEQAITPKVVGLLRPTVLLPAAALAGMPASELELILIHELGHIRRHDLWINLLQRLAEAVLFFNPGLWYLSRRTSALREYCCDEVVCRGAGGASPANRLGYAGALLRVAELSKPGLAVQGELAALAAAGKSPSELRRRVARLLGEPLRAPAPLTRGGLSLVAMAAILLAVGPSIAFKADAAAEEQKTNDKSLPGIKNTVTEKFSFGARAEVLAVGTHGEGPQPWWDPAGEPIDPVPFTWKEAGTVKSADKVWRRVVFRVHDLPDDADVQWHIRGAAASAGGTVKLVGADRGAAKGYFTRYFSLPEKVTLTGLRVGIANGPWRTVASAEGNSMAMGMNNHNLVFSEALATRHGTVVVISHDYFDESFRVIAVDKAGKTHASSYSGGVSAGKIYQTRPTFANVEPEDVDRFEFQIRDYEWVEFENLPMVPPPGAAADRSGAKADEHSMTIRVVDAAGKPIQGANIFQNHVHALAGQARHAIKNQNYTTDGEGKAVLTWPGESVDLRIWVRKVGYAPLHAMWSKEIQIDGGEIPAEFTFEMPAGVEIGGIVTDELGQPIAGAKIEVYDAVAGEASIIRAGPKPGVRPIGTLWLAAGDSAVTTDADGRWTANGIPPDKQLAFEDVDALAGHSSPLLLKVSHPGFLTFDGWKAPNQTSNPSLRELREKEAIVRLARDP